MLIELIDSIFMIYMIMLFIRILSSWFPEYRDHRFMLFISHYTDPYLNIFRRFIPPVGMIDFSPIIAFLCLKFLENFVKYLVTLFLI